ATHGTRGGRARVVIQITELRDRPLQLRRGNSLRRRRFLGRFARFADEDTREGTKDTEEDSAAASRPLYPRFFPWCPCHVLILLRSRVSQSCPISARAEGSAPRPAEREPDSCPCSTSCSTCHVRSALCSSALRGSGTRCCPPRGTRESQ